MIDHLKPWDAQACADYLGVSKNHFLQCVAHADGFPAPLEPYTYTHNGKRRVSQPEWAGVDVMTWRLGSARITPYLRQEAASA